MLPAVVLLSEPHSQMCCKFLRELRLLGNSRRVHNFLDKRDYRLPPDHPPIMILPTISHRASLKTATVRLPAVTSWKLVDGERMPSERWRTYPFYERRFLMRHLSNYRKSLATRTFLPRMCIPCPPL
jgi:hypothetical protein